MTVLLWAFAILALVMLGTLCILAMGFAITILHDLWKSR